MALTSDRIVLASLSILDDYGLADLTMRRVAESLGVKAGALYWHFPNKQTLLAAVADEILASRWEPDHDDMEAWLMDWASGVRARLLAHRDAAELVASTRAMGLAGIDPAGHAREVLSRQGASADEAEGVSQAFMHFILGHVMEEQTQSQLAALGVIKAFDAQRAQRHFDWGVRLLIAGVARGVSPTDSRIE